MDLRLASGSFTWLISHDRPVWSRIDGFLVSPDWEAQLPVVSQKRLSRLYLDHFENMWLKVEGFVGLVKQWWDSYSFQGIETGFEEMESRGVFGNVERNKRKLIEVFDEESRALGKEELLKKAEVVGELERCSPMEEVSWR
jgi:hypothetical protein